MHCRPPGSSVHGILQARILEWVAILLSRDLPDPGIELGSPALQADSLLSKPPGKPNRKLKLARGKKNKKQTSEVWSMKKCCRLVATFGNNNGNLCANGYLKFLSVAKPEGMWEKTPILNKCPWVGSGKIFQMRTDGQEDNLERSFLLTMLFLFNHTKSFQHHESY